MDYYYTDASNQPRGPVPLEQIRLLALQGQLTASCLVVPVGEKEWRSLSTVVPPNHPDALAGNPPLPYDPVPTAPPTEPLAIISLVLSILGFIICLFGPLLSIGAVICGHLALGKITRDNTGGRNLARAGLIVGYISLGLSALYLLINIASLVFSTYGK